MKPSAEDWENQELDKLLFEYLEGNLPDEQARELEKKAASDALLGTELEYWKETKVTAELYDTHLLEERLVRVESIPAKQPVESTKNTNASLYAFVWLVCICSVWPIRLKQEKTTLAPKYIVEILAREKSTPILAIVEQKQETRFTKRNSETQKRDLPISTSLYTEKTIPHLPDLRKVESNQLPVSRQIQEIRIPASASKKLRVPAIPATRTITRKQARQIARMKEKALQRRMANEFLKGRVPYVVPLNTQNF
ncbi:hypothetical protein Q0590_22885 [Rhodocytophaga aerolata]|uniref:Zf-HC2 domain-containing protein n=1 Tax=Rhodocytophaga aerolata TaxID=455078 RepID=A0ABT8RBS7_9BACT|nr:hypothetical protein [Rhodocytophaga aerolata]MDO1449141.1 hypothetical protein [Rhodocytophaga aerolata]